MGRPADPHAKTDLLRAAEAVFAERGLDHAKVEEITSRAGRSKGAFYLHFSSKEDAFRQIVESLLARLASCLEDRHDLYGPAMPPDGGAAVLAFWHARDLEILEFMWRNRALVRLMLEGGKSAAYAHLIDEFAERSREQTERILRWGVQVGLYRADLDVEIASLVVAGAYDRLVREVVRKPRKPDLARVARALQRSLMLGIATPVLASHVEAPIQKKPGIGRVRRRISTGG